MFVCTVGVDPRGAKGAANAKASGGCLGRVRVSLGLPAGSGLLLSPRSAFRAGAPLFPGPDSGGLAIDAGPGSPAGRRGRPRVDSWLLIIQGAERCPAPHAALRPLCCGTEPPAGPATPKRGGLSCGGPGLKSRRGLRAGWAAGRRRRLGWEVTLHLNLRFGTDPAPCPPARTTGGTSGFFKRYFLL